MLDSGSRSTVPVTGRFISILSLGVTASSGPGICLKTEFLGLALITELPLIIVDVQRGGPSTGLPTKTEQSDLLLALYGRNGESPVIVIAASTPANCFNYAFEASKLAVEHMTPVVLLSDGYIANGSAPWKIQSTSEMPDIKVKKMERDPETWHPYDRDDATLARDWAIPGMAGFEHRVGGLEKDKITGNVSYGPENHQYMTDIRAEKVQRVQNYIPAMETEFASEGELLVVGWGGTYGSLHAAVKHLEQEGINSVGLAHFNYLNPLPANTEEILGRFKKILVCELNTGQFASVLRSKFPNYDYAQFNKVQGLPFGNGELVEKFKQYL